MHKVNFVEFRKHLSQYVGQARFAGERIAVTYHGTIVGGFVSAEALKFLEEREMESDVEAYDQAVQRRKKKGSKTISHDEMVKRLNLDV